jgi:agmatinase
VSILGAPLDLTESFRSGTADAPASIRTLSQSLETYSAATGRDLTEVGIVDRGDLVLAGMSMGAALLTIGDAVRQAAEDGLVITLGGEHTVTLGAVRGLRQTIPDLAVLLVDAHLDLLDEYLGVRVGHATVSRRLLDEVGHGALLQVGIRSGTREEFLLARHNLLASPDLKLTARARSALLDRPIYLSVDIDVLDPAFAPGTGYPEPGGPSFTELADFLYSLAGLSVVAVDVCEVLPAVDPAGITSVAAAKLVRELAVLFG